MPPDPTVVEPAAFPFALYAATCAGVCLWFALTWLFARWKDNWSVVDVAWVISVPIFAYVPVRFTGGFDTRSGVVFILTCVWGFRLGAHLFGRVYGGREKEDPRYAEMRERWGAKAPATMFGFYQIQAVVVWVLLLPVFLASRDNSPYPAVTEMIGVVVVLAGIAGEAVADCQLKDWLRRRTVHGGVCENGLWRYSRHPNYFFEWIVWVGFAIASIASPAGYVGLLAPALMLWLLVWVSGIKLSEERYDRIKGPAWFDYKRRVSAFVPWFPKR